MPFTHLSEVPKLGLISKHIQTIDVMLVPCSEKDTNQLIIDLKKASYVTAKASTGKITISPNTIPLYEEIEMWMISHGYKPRHAVKIS